MLQAKLNNGKTVTLATLPRDKIEIYRRKHRFYCPVCRERVMIKAGRKVIPHFAHYRNVNCVSNGGGEGPYHNKGKLLLYQWLKSQRFHVALEMYIPDIKQQPDLLLTINDKTIAIEFQCARITTLELKKRIEGYRSLGMQSIWILGANLLQRKGKHHFKIDTFTRMFIHQLSPQQLPKLYYFCPHTLQIITFQDIYSTSVNQAIGRLTIEKLNQMIFTDLFKNNQFTQSNLYEEWKKKKKTFRLRRNGHAYGREQAWQQWLYLKGLHREHLPSIIYLPVSLQFKMNSAPWDWQSRLCLDMLEPLTIGQKFTIQNCIRFLRAHSSFDNDFPLIVPRRHPIIEYLRVLEQLNIIVQISKGYFVKKKQITHNKHIEQSIVNDIKVMEQLKNTL